MGKKLRAAVMLLVVGAAAAWPAIAVSASSATYYGKIGSSDGTMTITAQLTGGKVTEIKNISVYSLPMQCGTQGVVVAYNGVRVAVTNHKFKSVKHYSAAQGGPGTATTTGTVSSNNKKITGTTQYKGSLGTFTGCNTGKQTYTATRQ
jgi:hypothetical protein